MTPESVEETKLRDAIAELNQGAVTETAQRLYFSVTNTELNEEQRAFIETPAHQHHGEKHVMAIHWHPEYVPMEWIVTRVSKSFPDSEEQLLIPTQHNQLLSIGPYTGVEIDCYSPEFKLKVQLLLHFKNERLKQASTLKAMIDHTFRYRASQLFEFIDSLTEDAFNARVQKAAKSSLTGSAEIEFARHHMKTLKALIEENEHRTNPMMLRNKLVRDYFNALSPYLDPNQIHQVQAFLRTLKKIVKAEFNPGFFYNTQEIIEEARHNHAGIIIPHPEQFWPILLADYDVDGIEVWNPQSLKYTDFLIETVHRLNKGHRSSEHSILVTMGDDCHMGEKVLPPERQDRKKAAREIGSQPGWEELGIRKCLARYNISKKHMIQQYRERLD